LDSGTLTSGAAYLTTSAFQYISSTGACAMDGQIDQDSKKIIADNWEHLKVDFAKGHGEYAMAFASMYGCDHEAQKIFPKIIKNRFDELRLLDEDLEQVHALLDREIRMNRAIAPKCLIPNG
jgi:hypothetical protein